MMKSQMRLFLDIMINKTGTKIWMDICNKPTDSKRHVSFTSNDPRHCLTNILLSLARKRAIVENENVEEKHLKYLQKIH